MSKQCAVCNKLVYPMELVKYFEQALHKSCFKCSTCGATLNLKSCKSHEKKLYCHAHYPQPAKYTPTADSLQIQHLTQTTKVHSNIKYHEDFDRAKGIRRASASTSSEQPSIKNGTSAERPESLYSNSTDNFVRSDSNRGSSEVQPVSTRSSVFAENVEESNEEAAIEEEMIRTHRAIYDYKAADSDEVSFMEGDVILNGNPIDDGWMYGTVERTGEYGMLPANYVERI